MAFSRRIDNSLYSRKALADAREAYVTYCSVRAIPQANGQVDILVEVKPDYAVEFRQVTLEFWNYFLDKACQHRLESN